MNCPKCGKNNIMVYGGRTTDQGNYKRFRKCIDCDHKFRTIEYFVVPKKGRKKKI